VSVTRRIMLIYYSIIPEKNIYIYIYILCVCVCVCVLLWAGQLVGIATDYGLDGPGIESQWGLDFPPVQTGPGTHPASCKMGAWSFPGVEAAEACG